MQEFIKTKENGAKIPFDLQVYNDFPHTIFYSSVSGTRDKILSLLMRLGQKSAGKLCYLSTEEAAFTNFPEGIQLSVFFK